MKYIRTKEEIYIQCKLKGYENCYCLPSNTNITKKEDLVIFKQADNLKELCDVFVEWDKESNKFVGLLNWNEVNRPLWNTKEYFDSFSIFGAIWTDKGLIYVAKMNEKGDLELL